MVDRSAVLNIFTPGAEIYDPEVFAGRRQQVLDLTDALQAHQSVPLIYGHRGLGKTSLGYQAARIALGDVTLLAEYGQAHRALSESRRYTVFWADCSDSIRTLDQLLQRLINNAEGYSSSSLPSVRRVKAEKSKRKFTLKLFEAETEREYETKHLGEFSALTTEDKLTATIETLQAHGYPRLLFMVDELDRMASSAGLANFIKNTSSSDVKFLLIGIGHNVSTLLADHESLERSLIPIAVPPMSEEELDEIVVKASRRTELAQIPVSFSVDARERLVDAAGGFPWFVHVLGQASLVSAFDQGVERVERFHVEAAINELSRNRFAQRFADLYQKAVVESQHREIVLRLFTKWRGEDVPVGELYPVATALGVTNPSIAKTDLTKEKYGRVLVVPPDQDRGIVRFRNAMFRRYIQLRTSIFQGIKEDVDAMWEKYMAARSGPPRGPAA